jgi:lysophospholipase L1-like esterase
LNIIKGTVLWFLLPLSAIQGLLLRRTATRLSPPDGEPTGSTGAGIPLYLHSFGDSIIAGVGARQQSRTLPLQFAEALAKRLGIRVEWRIQARNGAKIKDLLIQIDSLASETHADVILISIGVNDVTGLTSATNWRRKLDVMKTKIRSRWPEAQVVFIGLPPMGQFPLPPQPLRATLGARARQFDHIAIQQLTLQEKMLHIPTEISPDQADFCEDGFHPSENGYNIWGEELAKRIIAESNLKPEC